MELETAEGERLKGDDGGTAAIRLRFEIVRLGEELSEERTTALVLRQAKHAPVAPLRPLSRRCACADAKLRARSRASGTSASSCCGS
eukprot:2513911-Rhodomonas_salina.4